MHNLFLWDKYYNVNQRKGSTDFEKEWEMKEIVMNILALIFIVFSVLFVYLVFVLYFVFVLGVYVPSSGSCG